HGRRLRPQRHEGEPGPSWNMTVVQRAPSAPARPAEARSPPPARGARVLILCADIGEGHVTVARALAARLRQRPEVDTVEMRDDLRVMGPWFGAFMDRGFHAHLDGIGQPDRAVQRFSYELGY